MLKKLLIIFSLFPFTLLSQGSANCDSLYFSVFKKFINFNDSVKFELKNHVNTHTYPFCQIDTISLISFVLSEEEFSKHNLNKNSNSDKILNKITKSNLVKNTDYLYNSDQDSNSNPFLFQQTTNLTKRTNYIPLDVLKIYFISALYYNDFSFANKIILIRKDKEATVNINLDNTVLTSNEYELKIVNQKIIKKTLKSCRKWKKLVDLKGLEFVRVNNISPLFYEKKVTWKEIKTTYNTMYRI